MFDINAMGHGKKVTHPYSIQSAGFERSKDSHGIEAVQSSYVGLSVQGLTASRQDNQQVSISEKAFSKEDQKKIDSINQDIDKILGKDKQDIKLSGADKKSALSIYKQVEGIFSDGKVTKKEQQQLEKLNQQQHEIMEKYHQPKELTQQQHKKLEQLFGKLDAIYSKGETGVSPWSKQDKSALQALEKQMNTLMDKLAPKVSQTDQKAMDKLEKELGERYKKDSPDEQHLKKTQELEDKLNKLYEKVSPQLTKEQNKQLNEISEKMEGLYNKYTPSFEYGMEMSE